jgi:hypothetical protein
MFKLVPRPLNIEIPNKSCETLFFFFLLNVFIYIFIKFERAYLGPFHHNMARHRVVDGGDRTPDMEGNSEYIE